MSKKIAAVFMMFLIIFPLVIWGVSLFKCEMLTARYGDEFSEIYKENTMLGDIEYFKVLDYTDSSAKVYYVSHDYSGGDVLAFEKENGEWKYSEWETVWSEMGSTDGFLWPYITDTVFYGLKIFEKNP